MKPQLVSGPPQPVRYAGHNHKGSAMQGRNFERWKASRNQRKERLRQEKLRSKAPSVPCVPPPEVRPPLSLAELCCHTIGANFSAFSLPEFKEYFLTLPPGQLERVSAVASREGELENEGVALLAHPEVQSLCLHGSLDRGLEALVPLIAFEAAGEGADVVDDWEALPDDLDFHVPTSLTESGCLRLIVLELHSPVLSAKTFGRVVPSLPTLRHLALRGCFGDSTRPGGTTRKPNRLNRKPNLDSSGGKIAMDLCVRQEGAVALLDHVPKLMTLTHLDVSYNRWVTDSLLNEFVLLVESSSRLPHLRFVDCLRTEVYFIHFSRHLCPLSTGIYLPPRDPVHSGGADELRGPASAPPPPPCLSTRDLSDEGRRLLRWLDHG